jgi:hypothetical protein
MAAQPPEAIVSVDTLSQASVSELTAALAMIWNEHYVVSGFEELVPKVKAASFCTICRKM